MYKSLIFTSMAPWETRLPGKIYIFINRWDKSRWNLRQVDTSNSTFYHSPNGRKKLTQYIICARSRTPHKDNIIFLLYIFICTRFNSPRVTLRASRPSPPPRSPRNQNRNWIWSSLCPCWSEASIPCSHFLCSRRREATGLPRVAVRSCRYWISSWRLALPLPAFAVATCYVLLVSLRRSVPASPASSSPKK